MSAVNAEVLVIQVESRLIIIEYFTIGGLKGNNSSDNIEVEGIVSLHGGFAMDCLSD
jgi:hypothetical protein